MSRSRSASSCCGSLRIEHLQSISASVVPLQDNKKQLQQQKDHDDQEEEDQLRNSISSSLHRYKIKHPLGKGAGSFVWQIQDYKTSTEYALKSIVKQSEHYKQNAHRIANESKLHSTLSHPNIVRMLKSFEDCEYVYIMMEFCESGNLFQYFKTKGRLSEEEAAEITFQIVLGLEYLHQNKIIHRDLKPANIVLTATKAVKICDFGLAVKLDDFDEERNTFCGTPNYIAPEICKREPYGMKSDCWSFGCILYLLVVGRPPFESASVQDTLKILQKNQHIDVPSFVSKPLSELITQILDWNSQSRSSITDIKEHPFYARQNKLHNEKTIILPKQISSGSQPEAITHLSCFKYETDKENVNPNLPNRTDVTTTSSNCDRTTQRVKGISKHSSKASQAQKHDEQLQNLPRQPNISQRNVLSALFDNASKTSPSTPISTSSAKIQISSQCQSTKEKLSLSFQAERSDRHQESVKAYSTKNNLPIGKGCVESSAGEYSMNINSSLNVAGKINLSLSKKPTLPRTCSNPRAVSVKSPIEFFEGLKRKFTGQDVKPFDKSMKLSTLSSSLLLPGSTSPLPVEIIQAFTPDVSLGKHQSFTSSYRDARSQMSKLKERELTNISPSQCKINYKQSEMPRQLKGEQVAAITKSKNSGGSNLHLSITSSPQDRNHIIETSRFPSSNRRSHSMMEASVNDTNQFERQKGNQFESRRSSASKRHTTATDWLDSQDMKSTTEQVMNSFKIQGSNNSINPINNSFLRVQKSFSLSLADDRSYCREDQSVLLDCSTMTRTKGEGSCQFLRNTFSPVKICREIEIMSISTKNGVIEVTPDRSLVIKSFNNKLIFQISQDGMHIKINKLTDVPVERNYELPRLPVKYHSMYGYAKSVLKVLPKKQVVSRLEISEGVFSLLKNGCFEASFKSGFEVSYKKKSSLMRIFLSDPSNSSPFSQHLPVEFLMNSTPINFPEEIKKIIAKSVKYYNYLLSQDCEN